MSRECTETEFLKDVEAHELTILRDDGVYRHLRFRRPGTYCMGFDILTWPGYLTVTGDMGEYIFQRIEDMLEFFRSDRPGLRINPGYWAEKCQAADTRGKLKEFDKDTFRKAVTERLAEFCGDQEDNPGAVALLAELTERVHDEVFSRLDEYDHQWAVAEALSGFEHNGRAVFDDFWENTCEEFTFHYTWICYAIAWGVIRYDSAKKVPVRPPPGLLMSMAIRMDHGLGLPGYYDQNLGGQSIPGTHEQRLRAALATAEQLWEEVTGRGFYKPEREAEYAAKGAQVPSAQPSEEPK